MNTNIGPLPIIQKTPDEMYVHINERCFARTEERLFMPINPDVFNKAVQGQALITWDPYILYTQ